MNFSHALVTRPRAESEELAGLLEPLGLDVIIQPAFRYVTVDAHEQQGAEMTALETADSDDLLLFTSPRSVAHGLAQIPPGTLGAASIAAIGPASKKALNSAGLRVTLTAAGGYTSEALLEAVAERRGRAGHWPARVFIFAAPGGRDKLARGLASLGCAVTTLMVYRAEQAEIDRAQFERLDAGAGLLSVWTSGNTIKALSQRLPPAAWFRICQGEWVVISERLKRLARAYGPARIHLTSGPGNAAILAAVRGLL